MQRPVRLYQAVVLGLVAVAILLAACRPALVTGQSPAPPAAYLPRVTRAAPPQLAPAISLGGVTYALAVNGERVAVGHGLRVGLVDYADPAAPRLLGEVGPFTDHVRALALRGDLLVVANEREGLKLYDVGEPTRARLLGSAPIADQARDVALVGDVAYVAADGAGLVIVDIADAAAPVQVGALDGPGHDQRVLVQPPLAYLAAGEAGALVVDVSNPAAPALLGRAFGVTVDGARLYVAASDAGVLIYDLGEPGRPRPVGRVDTEGEANTVVPMGPRLVVGYSDGVRWLDVSDPARPVLLAYRHTAEAAGRLAVAGDVAWVGLGGLGLLGLRLVP